MELQESQSIPRNGFYVYTGAIRNESLNDLNVGRKYKLGTPLFMKDWDVSCRTSKLLVKVHDGDRVIDAVYDSVEELSSDWKTFGDFHETANVTVHFDDGSEKAYPVLIDVLPNLMIDLGAGRLCLTVAADPHEETFRYVGIDFSKVLWTEIAVDESYVIDKETALRHWEFSA